MIRIILGGEWRGNESSWDSLKKFKDYHSANVYVSAPNQEEWQLPFSFYSVGSNRLDDTIFNQSTHPHKERYIWQWSSLYKAYTYFNNMYKFDDEDIIVKLRNDLVYKPFNLKAEKDTIHTPAKEYHAAGEFFINLVCNDQIIYGYNSVMKKYFNLPYHYTYTDRNPSAVQKYGDVLGIEEMLRNYLYQQDIKLETFHLNYTKV